LFYAVKEDEKNGSVCEQEPLLVQSEPIVELNLIVLMRSIAVLELMDNGKNLKELKTVSSGGGAPAHCVVVADGKALAVGMWLSHVWSLLELR
jgi:hypothetical protein